MNLHRWLREHSLKLLAIRDTPEAIAGGVAIGFFFGFTPLFGLKTLCAILVAWLTGSNILAAVIASAMHDVLLPFMPLIYRWEYKLGYWILSHPHHWPPPLRSVKWDLLEWQSWTTFFTVGRPWLLGSVLCGAPVALVAFLVTKSLVARHQHKKRMHTRSP